MSTKKLQCLAREGKVPCKGGLREVSRARLRSHTLSAVCDGFISAREHGYYCPGSYHLTARFCTSPFLSSSNFKSIFTTFFSLSSSSFIESFCSSIIRSLVAINLKGHRVKSGLADVQTQMHHLCITWDRTWQLVLV